MKHKFHVTVGAALVVAAVSAFVYVNNEKDPMDDLFYANVEALARGEAGGKALCYSMYSTGSSGMRSLECVTCRYTDGTGITKGGYCKW